MTEGARGKWWETAEHCFLVTSAGVVLRVMIRATLGVSDLVFAAASVMVVPAAFAAWSRLGAVETLEFRRGRWRWWVVLIALLFVVEDLLAALSREAQGLSLIVIVAGLTFVIGQIYSAVLVVRAFRPESVALGRTYESPSPPGAPGPADKRVATAGSLLTWAVGLGGVAAVFALVAARWWLPQGRRAVLVVAILLLLILAAPAIRALMARVDKRVTHPASSASKAIRGWLFLGTSLLIPEAASVAMHYISNFPWGMVVAAVVPCVVIQLYALLRIAATLHGEERPRERTGQR
jgi:hypothetical protein